MSKNALTEKRIKEVYEYLVDNTQIPSVFRSRELSKLNSKLLALVEYIRGEEDTSPLQDWFEANYD